ncbi:hypothetical protein DPQ33_12125 [Oceanidesulfovibrio indonesiensis]|uniref:Uncharacterized protein n=1 Tax=Oceanidesulfovibrio indonesiensis TaxID=54767 RepID=A0A7M3MD06_9BACT|nr:hypothetical protein [Oceanidesulfovibrio indonesiensis]TVM16365.1 hypothetical protein DPQ33_12125 [Oceanidesulfovibrio indonesiensis]
MSHEEIRVYGYVKGLPSESFIALMNGLGPLFQEESFRHEGRTLNVEFEGAFFLIEDFLEALLPLLSSDAEGKIDYIDHHAWEMTRYTINGQELASKRVDLNTVLEKYHQE